MRRIIHALLFAFCLGGPVPAGTDEEPVGVALVPFRNVGGAPGAVAEVMPALTAALEARGIRPVNGRRIDDYLRRNRIRTRDALTADELRELAAMLGVRYVMVGTIDAWGRNHGPEVGFSGRILDAERELVLWAGSSSRHVVPEPGLLALARPRTLWDATAHAVRDMLTTLRLRSTDDGRVPAQRLRAALRGTLARTPIAFRSPELDRIGTLRIALLPWDNRSRVPEAPMIVGDHLMALLVGTMRVEVVDPGEVREALIELDLQPIYGIDPEELQRLGEALQLDAVLEGMVLHYENGGRTVPAIDLFARLRDVETGTVLWSATTARNGDGTRTVYDLGRLRSIDRLAESALSDLLSTWFR